MNTETVLQVILAWLAQSYPTARLPVGLIYRSLVPSTGADPHRINAAVRVGIDRGLLQQHGHSGDGAIVSLTQLGHEQGHQLLTLVQPQLGVGRLTPAARACLETVVETFRQVLQSTAVQWAQNAASDTQPLHVILSARSLSAGALAAAIEEIDRTRDKSQDGPAQDKLLELLFKASGGHQ